MLLSASYHGVAYMLMYDHEAGDPTVMPAYDPDLGEFNHGATLEVLQPKVDHGVYATQVMLVRRKIALQPFLIAIKNHGYIFEQFGACECHSKFLM